MNHPAPRLLLFRIAALYAILTFCTTAQAEVVDVSSAELQALLAKGVPVVDVRLAEEWAETGVLAGSHRMTFFDARGGYDAKAWYGQLGEVATPEDPVILICLTGSRSRVIANWLSGGMGHERVYNVAGGIDDWLRQGLPVKRN